MEVTMNNDLVSGGFEIAQPRNKLPILHRRAAMVIIWNDEERTMSHSFLRKLRQNILRDRLGRWRDVVNRDDKEILRRAGCRDDGQKLRSRNRGHFGKFSTPRRVRTSANYRPIRAIKSNSRLPSGSTESRDCRTSAIFLSRGFALICARGTGLASGFVGARSTELQSSSFAVRSV